MAGPQLIFFIALSGFHIRWWTFALLVAAIAGFAGAIYFNYMLENVIRVIRSKIVGSFGPAVAHARRGRWWVVDRITF